MSESSPKLFTLEQLGRLQEVPTSIDCECPNQLAIVLTNLGGFEDYSARCQSADIADRDIHAMLYRETQKARIIMEAALQKLIVHEKIEV
ncbi:MAG: hypothetical protein H7Z43_06745 [Clostridia bacterium]|nr:hypothetical protein [Deltaproteobacteria bacterium]